MAQINADILRTRFGFNDPNVIANILRDPGQVERYNREYSQQLNPTASAPSSSTSSFDVEGFLTKQKAEGEALRTKQAKEEEALFKTFETKAAAQPKLTTIYEDLLKEAGIPGFQKSVTAVQKDIFDTKALIDKLEADITARTAGTLTTEAQRRRQIAAEREPLSANLGRLATGLTPTVEALRVAREDIGTKLALKAGEQTKELEPERMRIAAVSDRFARETTGYTQDRQDTLSLLLSKIQRDEALSVRQWQEAQDLAKSEREWENKKKELELTSINAIKLKQTLEPKAGVGGVVNPFLAGGVTTKMGGGKASDPYNIFGLPGLTFTNLPKSGGFGGGVYYG